MRVLMIVHEEDAGAGVFHEVLVAADARVDTWLVTAQPEPPSRPGAYDAIMTFGGSAHPHQEDRHPWLATEKRFLAEALERRVPLLGICLGSELIAEVAGATPHKLAHPEIGWYEVVVSAEGESDPLIGPTAGSFAALEWHSYAVPLPEGATALASSENCIQAYRLGDCVWGLQFHAEVTAHDFQHWLDNYTDDEDAVAEGIDPDAIARDTAGYLDAWNELGRGVCQRFLQVAARATEHGNVRAAL